MRFFIFSAALLLLIHSSHCDSDAEGGEEEDAYLYNEVDFQQSVESKAHFIMFFAPWCGHCKSLKPIWTELSEFYNKEKPDVIGIAKVDCTTDTKLCSENGVTGYPTLKFFQPGKEAERYKGARDLDSLKKFISDTLNLEGDQAEEEKPGVEVEEGLYELTTDTFDTHIATGSHFVKFFAPWCGHCKRMEPAWKEVAAKMKDSDTVKIGRVDCTKDQQVCGANGVRGYPTLIWFKDGQEVEKYEGARQLVMFLEYIEKMTGGGDTKQAQALTMEKEEEQEEKPKELEIVEGLYELNNDNFEPLTANGDFFIKFFAPWCGHCKRMEPAWKELAKFYENDDLVGIGRVDCTKEPDLCQSKGVRGYPTLKYFKAGKEVDGSPSGRDIENLKKFVATMSGKDEPVAEQVTDEEQEKEEEEEKPKELEIVEGLYELNNDNFEPLTANGDFFIKFFAPWCGHCKRMEPAWKELAKFYENDDLVGIGRVDCTKEPDLCQSKGVRGYPTLKYFKAGKEVDGSPSGRDIENLKKFVATMSGKDEPVAEQVTDEEQDKEEEEEKPEGPEIVEGLYELDNDNFETLTANGDFFIKFFAPWCGHCIRMEPAWKELAKFYENDDLVGIGRVDCTKNSDLCQSKGARGYPTLKYFKAGKEVAGSPAGRDIENLKKFVATMSGKDEPVAEQVTDEEPQEQEKEEEVEADGATELNEETFENVIEAGIVFVKFYAPWCGHCKRLAPTWDELSKEDFSDVSKPVLIAKVDCTKHNTICQDYEVSGYPTLKIFVDGEMKQKYKGGRTLEALKNFVLESAVDIVKEEEEQTRDEL